MATASICPDCTAAAPTKPTRRYRSTRYAPVYGEGHRSPKRSSDTWILPSASKDCSSSSHECGPLRDDHDHLLGTRRLTLYLRNNGSVVVGTMSRISWNFGDDPCGC